MRINGNNVNDSMMEVIKQLVNLHVTTMFITSRNEQIPCKMLIAEMNGDVSKPTLSGMNCHIGYYDPETKTLYEYRQPDGICVIYNLLPDYLCCERDPKPNEELLCVDITSHKLSDLIGSDSKGTHTHRICLT